MGEKRPVLSETSTIIDAANAVAEDGVIDIQTSKGSVRLTRPPTTASPPNPFHQDNHRLLDIPIERAAYSDRTAWIMATLSGFAYYNFEDSDAEHRKLVDHLKEAGIDLLEAVTADTDTQFIAVRMPKRFLAVVFRGTEANHADIFTDLDARFDKTGHGGVHAGFMAAFESVRGSLLEILEKHKVENEPLFFAGHSLGGALATIATQEVEQDHPVAACYTFGSPRVGSAQWSDKVKAPCYRVVNNFDAVTLVPLSGALLFVVEGLAELTPIPGIAKWIGRLKTVGFIGYQHVGDLRFLYSGDDGDAGLKKGSAGTLTRFRFFISGILAVAAMATTSVFKMVGAGGLKAMALVGDHRLGGYLDKLETIAKRKNPRTTATP